MMSLTGRLGMGALVLLCVLLIFNINKAHVYQVKNIELSRQIELRGFELRSANAQAEFANFQLEQSREMNIKLQEERKKISNKYDNIIERNNLLKDENISEKLVSILNEINKE